MNISQIKELMISSLNSDADANEVSGKLKEAGISYNFSPDFRDNVLNKLFSATSKNKQGSRVRKIHEFCFLPYSPDRSCSNCGSAYLNVFYGRITFIELISRIE